MAFLKRYAISQYSWHAVFVIFVPISHIYFLFGVKNFKLSC